VLLHTCPKAAFDAPRMLLQAIAADTLAGSGMSAAHGVQLLSCASCACRRELLRGPLYYVLMLVAITLVYWRESPAGFLVRALQVQWPETAGTMHVRRLASATNFTCTA
jgi:hypothetical protein